MKIGVIIGSASGRGSAVETLTPLASRLMSHEVAVCKDNFGRGAPPSWARLVPKKAAAGYVQTLRASVASLLDWGAKLLICIGGDGLASYVLDAMVSRDGAETPAETTAGATPKMRVALMGIASGSVNVGPIVTFGPEDIPTLDIDALAATSRKSIDAVDVSVDGRHLAYGLNDVVIGNSFLGTLDGVVVNLSASALLRDGVKRMIEPSSNIASGNFRLRKNGAPVAVSMKKPAQIIASPLGRHEFFGRAVAGVLCNAAFMDGAAALALFDSVIVRAAAPAHGFTDMARSEHLLFGPGDRIELSGLGPDADIIVDGNPYERKGETVGLSFRADIADVLVPPARTSARAGAQVGSEIRAEAQTQARAKVQSDNQASRTEPRRNPARDPASKTV